MTQSGRAPGRSILLITTIGLEAEGQGLAGHEAGLGHRAFDRVDQQQHAVDHRQHALDLAAEVGVARGVDDVDVGVAVLDGAVLRRGW